MRNIFIALLSLTLFVAAAGAQSFQVVGVGTGTLTVQSSGALSSSTDSGFTSNVQLQSVKYKGNFSGAELATLVLTTGAPISGTPNQDAYFAPGGAIVIQATGDLNGTTAQRFKFTGVFSGRQTWLAANGHLLLGTVLGHIDGEIKNHSYSLVLATTPHDFSGNGYMNVSSVIVTRIN